MGDDVSLEKGSSFTPFLLLTCLITTNFSIFIFHNLTGVISAAGEQRCTVTDAWGCGVQTFTETRAPPLPSWVTLGSRSSSLGLSVLTCEGDHKQDLTYLW